MKYPFHAILEYGLGDYDDRIYEYDVTEEQLSQIQAAVKAKQYFDECAPLHDLYQTIFDIVYKAEYERYMDHIYSSECDHEPIAGEDFIPFENHTLYLTF